MKLTLSPWDKSTFKSNLGYYSTKLIVFALILSQVKTGKIALPKSKNLQIKKNDEKPKLRLLCLLRVCGKIQSINLFQECSKYIYMVETIISNSKRMYKIEILPRWGRGGVSV